MTESAIRYGIGGDLYAALGEPLKDGAWSMRLYHKPLVIWIWLGALVMASGAALSVVAQRRLRSTT
jgi:cytochrome c-type biogenesis protein CcmF